MKIITLKITPQTTRRAYVSALVEGDIDYSLPSAVIGKDYELVIQEKKKKRTLTANAYYQVLLDQLASALRAPRQEVHEMLLQRYGVTANTDGRRVLFTLRTDINPHYVSKYVEALETKNIKGVDFTVYRVLKGSSEMTNKEFANLLDGLISECKELGIETITPEEARRLKYE